MAALLRAEEVDENRTRNTSASPGAFLQAASPDDKPTTDCLCHDNALPWCCPAAFPTMPPVQRPTLPPEPTPHPTTFWRPKTTTATSDNSTATASSPQNGSQLLKGETTNGTTTSRGAGSERKHSILSWSRRRIQMSIRALRYQYSAWEDASRKAAVRAAKHNHSSGDNDDDDDDTSSNSRNKTKTRAASQKARSALSGLTLLSAFDRSLVLSALSSS